MKKLAISILIISVIALNTGCGDDSSNSGDVVTAVKNSATAVCNDGSLSYSTSAKGTCSQHGGVKEWINYPGN